jgi:hypothetical protein
MNNILVFPFLHGISYSPNEPGMRHQANRTADRILTCHALLTFAGLGLPDPP